MQPFCWLTWTVDKSVRFVKILKCINILLCEILPSDTPTSNFNKYGVAAMTTYYWAILYLLNSLRHPCGDYFNFLICNLSLLFEQMNFIVVVLLRNSPTSSVKLSGLAKSEHLIFVRPPSAITVIFMLYTCILPTDLLRLFYAIIVHHSQCIRPGGWVEGMWWCREEWCGIMCVWWREEGTHQSVCPRLSKRGLLVYRCALKWVP